MKKKNLLLLLLALCMVQTTIATTPMRKVFGAKQSDGTSVTVQKMGNGHFGFYVTTDGMALLRNAAGDLCYAALTENGLEATTVMAHNEALRSEGERQIVAQRAVSASDALEHLMKMQPAERRVQSMPLAVGGGDGMGTLGNPAVNGVVKCSGSPVIPVIMVEFSDKKFLPTTTEEKLSRALNEKGYADEEGCKGCVGDYFNAQSGGRFTPVFDVVAKVAVENGYAYYGKNSGSTIDLNTTTLVKEAIAAAQEKGVDFSKYVEDGKVPLVSIYYAGPGEHSSYEAGCDDYLWAHFNTFRNTTVGGVKFASFFVGNELLQTYSGTEENPVVESADFDGIGIFIHEFGHALGLPDFYYTGNNASIYNRLETLSYWSIMDYGQYWLDGYAPIGYSAYERSLMGWLDVQELTQACHAELYPLGTKKGTTAYCIKSSTNEKEYFILENRQEDTWFPSLLGHGMLITHVDYDSSSWNNNTLNNTETRQRYSYVPADNTKYNEDGSVNGYQGDLFPGVTGATEFSDETTPAAKLNSGEMLGKPVYNITEKDGVISFSYLDKSLTGIQEATIATDGACEVYSIDGRKVRSGKQTDVRQNLASGIYVIKTSEGSKTVRVK